MLGAWAMRGTCSLGVLLVQILGNELSTLEMSITGCSDIMARLVWPTDLMDPAPRQQSALSAQAWGQGL